jgi:chromosome segregation ATPase
MAMSETAHPVDYDAAASELAWFGVKLKNTLALADEIRGIGSLKQAGQEAQSRLDALKQAHADAAAQHEAEKTTHVKTIEGLRQQIAEHENSLAERHQKADAEIKAKRDAADKIIAEAKEAAAGIAAQGQTDAAAVVAQAKASVVADENAAAAKRQELAEAQTALDELKIQHAELSAEVARLKAKFS